MSNVQIRTNRKRECRKTTQEIFPYTSSIRQIFRARCRSVFGLFGFGESWRYPDARSGGSAMAGSLHDSARTMPRVRAELQAPKEKTSSLAQRFGLSRTTVTKWRARTTTDEVPMGPSSPHSTVLIPAEEAMMDYGKDSHAILTHRPAHESLNSCTPRQHAPDPRQPRVPRVPKRRSFVHTSGWIRSPQASRVSAMDAVVLPDSSPQPV